MAYREAHFRIRSDYAWNQGWGSTQDGESFHQETRTLFAADGWTLEASTRDCVCDTVRKGQQALYLHPMDFSGIVEENEIPHIEAILAQAVTFRCEGTDLYEEYLDLSDDDYWLRLLGQHKEIEAAILERYRTKRRNLYITEGQAQNIARHFSVCRICDKEGRHNKANLYVGALIDHMLKDGRLVAAQTRCGMGIRTATKKDWLSTKEAS